MQLYPCGTRIAGRYEVAGQPLVGGMGIVYFCFDHKDQRPVALKTFQPEYLPDRAARDRFLQEGETWVRLGKHPHIVRCYEVFQDSPRPEVYLALELIAKDEGRRDASLRSWLTPGRPLPVDQALLIALQIVRGMSHATATIPGFVHRDLKPENVLVGADRLSNAACQRVRVTDFGLVKGLRAEQLPIAGAADLLTTASRLTRVGAPVGTPLYMAPEQWEGVDVTVQADIYALGCILGEMVTGWPLVQGKTLDAVRWAHRAGQALAGVQAAPLALRDLLAGCLAVVPGGRYAGWSEVEAALATACCTATGQPAPGSEVADAQTRAERVAVGWSYNVIGNCYRQMGQAAMALGYLAHALHVGQIEGERGLEGAGLGNLGLVYRELGEVQRAICYHEQALAIARAIGNRYWEGGDLGNLGAAYLALGDAQRAIGYFEQALATDREIGDRSGEGKALASLGNACFALGDVRRAIDYYEQALVIDRETGDQAGEAADRGSLGSAYYALGDGRRAIGYYEQALAVARKIGNRREAGNRLCNLGNAYLQLGDARRAAGYHKQALAIACEIGDRLGEGAALGGLGTAYANLGNARQAIGYFEQALAIRRKTGDVDGLAADSLNMALLLAGQGETVQALPLAQEAASLWSQMGLAAYAERAQQLVLLLQGRGC